MAFDDAKQRWIEAFGKGEQMPSQEVSKPRDGDGRWRNCALCHGTRDPSTSYRLPDLKLVCDGCFRNYVSVGRYIAGLHDEPCVLSEEAKAILNRGYATREQVLDHEVDTEVLATLGWERDPHTGMWIDGGRRAAVCGLSARLPEREKLGTEPVMRYMGMGAVHPASAVTRNVVATEYVAENVMPGQITEVSPEAFRAGLRGLQTVPSRLHPEDLTVQLSQIGDPTSWSAEAEAEPLLPPDPDAFGSLHWLQYQNGSVWPAMWARMSERSTSPHFRLLSPDAFSVATAPRWRYHSQMAVPAPLAAPEDPEVERVWAAVQDAARP